MLLTTQRSLTVQLGLYDLSWSGLPQHPVISSPATHYCVLNSSCTKLLMFSKQPVLVCCYIFVHATAFAQNVLFYSLPLLYQKSTSSKLSSVPLLIVKFYQMSPHSYRFITTSCQFPLAPCLCFSCDTVDHFQVCLPHCLWKTVTLSQYFFRILRQQSV